MLMNMGGMQITPRPRYAPSRMLDPPGTTRTADQGPSGLSGSVSLSKKGHRPWSADMSMVSPARKPSRIPRLTHVFTFQPDGDSASGSAARTDPSESAPRSDTNA